MTDSTLSAEQREQIGPILGKIPSGVFILTAGDGDGRETGMLASWVQQASFDPPLLSVAVNSKRYLNDWVARHPFAALSCVGKSQSASFFKQFGRGFEPDEPAFEGVDITRGETGLPLLANAIGSLEGDIVGTLPAGDHTIYLLQVRNAVKGKAFETDEPLVHLRKNGFNY
jgi:flavin reductase (DIM6/NTAB) family NADH-FMN oxidoreductase RutF